MKQLQIENLLKNGMFLLIYSKQKTFIENATKELSFIKEYLSYPLLDDKNLFVYSNPTFADTKGEENFKLINYVSYNKNTSVDKLNATEILNYSSNAGLKKDFLESLSMTYLHEHKIRMISDYWGMNTYYYYHDNDKFIISNNIFLIKNIIKPDVDLFAIYEILFFNYPLNNITYFKGINKLRPHQELEYNTQTNEIKLNDYDSYDEFFNKINGKVVEEEIISEFSSFFSHFQKDEHKNYLALSSGSDSTTVLALLLSHKITPTAVNFGSKNYLESSAVKKLSKQLNFPMIEIELLETAQNYMENYHTATIISNGLINPLRVHYYLMHKIIEANSNFFYGFFGSEFIKAEIAFDAMISLPHYEVISHGKSIKDVINKYYPNLTKGFSSDFENYISTMHSKILCDINAKQNKANIKEFLLEYEPSLVFSGILKISKFFGQNPVVPYLDKNNLRAVFKNGFGIIGNSNLESNFVGPIRSIAAESILVKKFYNRLYNHLLDRSITYKEGLEGNVNVVERLKKARKLKNKLARYVDSKFPGQINNNFVREILLKEISKIKLDDFPIPILNKDLTDIQVKNIYNLHTISSI